MTRRELTDEQLAARFPKKPGRTAAPAAQPVAVVVSGVETAQEVAAVDGLAQLQAGYGEERDLLNQLLGQAQMADAFANFSRTVRTSKLAYVRENKLYRAMKGTKTANGSLFSGTWDEFCELLGTSRDKVELDIANLKAFGEEALESMSKMGIGYRELRQYRRLPEDQKLALIEVAKAGDKEGFVELAEEIIAKHAREKESLTASLEAKDRVLADKNAHLTRLEEQVSRKFKAPAGSAARSAAEQALVTEVEQACSAAYLAMHRTFVAAAAALDDSGGAAPEAIQQRARHAVEFLSQQLVDMAEEFGISVDLEERLTPTWLNEEALAAIEARNAANPHTNARAQ